MKVCFYSNYMSHHQLPFSLAMLDRLGKENFVFIADERIDNERLHMGWEDMNSRYDFIVRAYEPSSASSVKSLLLDCDVLIVGSVRTDRFRERLLQNKLTFKYSERPFKENSSVFVWLKRTCRMLLDFFPYRNKNYYCLCSSAYTAYDYSLYNCFLDKTYKWGYFTKVDKFLLETSANFNTAKGDAETHLMWCARFLIWKHPEMPVKLAKKLKDSGYRFRIDMYGCGEGLEDTKRLALDLDVCDSVKFCGVVPNEEMLAQMRKHEIFLFTSDQNEGWGAVLNEAMSNGCVPVASRQIGSVPFLIKDGINGMVFESCDEDMLFNCVCNLLNNPNKRREMSSAAYCTMTQLWNPSIAADNLITLCTELLAGKSTDVIQNGPCSKAEIIRG